MVGFAVIKLNTQRGRSDVLAVVSKTRTALSGHLTNGVGKVLAEFRHPVRETNKSVVGNHSYTTVLSSRPESAYLTVCTLVPSELVGRAVGMVTTFCVFGWIGP
jgi:hypothetical protein